MPRTINISSPQSSPCEFTATVPELAISGNGHGTPTDEGTPCLTLPTVALTWLEAEVAIDVLSRGWMYVERDDFCRPGERHLRERELDAVGNEEQPATHGFFSEPNQAVRYAAALWRRQAR